MVTRNENLCEKQKKEQIGSERTEKNLEEMRLMTIQTWKKEKISVVTKSRVRKKQNGHVGTH